MYPVDILDFLENTVPIVRVVSGASSRDVPD